MWKRKFFRYKEDHYYQIFIYNFICAVRRFESLYSEPPKSSAQSVQL